MNIYNSSAAQTLSVDIGGSHIATALIVSDAILSNSCVNVKVDANDEAEAILTLWTSSLLKTIEYATSPSITLGVAMPGPFDYENGISLIKNMQKYDALYGFNIKNIFASRLKIPENNIHFFNDARSFLMGEAVAGAGVGYNSLIGITLGTGVGSAVCLNLHAKDVNRGSDPFFEGIVEAYLSTRWFVKRYKELTGKVVAHVKALCNLVGEDFIVGQIFDEFAVNLTLFLSKFIAEENPEAVIIGGNITKVANRFLPRVKATLSENFPNVIIEETRLWEHAAHIGAAHMAQNKGILKNLTKAPEELSK